MAQCSAVQCSAVQCSAVHRVCNHPLPSGAVRFGTSCALQRAATCNRAACHRCNAAPSHRHVATGADHTCDGGQHCAAVRRRPSHDGCATTGGAERGGPNELRCGLAFRSVLDATAAALSLGDSVAATSAAPRRRAAVIGDSGHCSYYCGGRQRTHGARGHHRGEAPCVADG